MNWYVFEIAVNLYQGFLFLFFMRKLLTYQKVNVWIDLVFIIITGVLLSIHQFYSLTIPDTLIFIIPLLHAILFADERWYVCVFWCMILAIITIGMAELMGCMLSLWGTYDWEMLLSESTARLIYVIGANIAITMLTVLIASLRRTHNIATVHVTITFLTVLMLELLTNEGIYNLQAKYPEGQDVYVWISVFSLIAVLLIIILYETMNAMNTRQRNAELANRTTVLSRAYQEELKLTYQRMLADQHDLRKRLDIVESLLVTNGNDKYDHIDVFLGENHSLRIQATGNIAVDAILTAKESAMQHANIEFSYSGIPMCNLPIPEDDFCVLLSNLLDNAIEGVLRLPATAQLRRVRLVIAKTWNMFSIICQNDMNPSTLKKTGISWVSSKPDSSVHGFGTQSIRSIVESADGFVEFRPEGDQFVISILIPDSSSKQDGHVFCY